ncbi:hypothetical protein EON63_11085 [archaeon]|nr:MAG: hypothetical protein EON63_11085 [archaeon]
MLEQLAPLLTVLSYISSCIPNFVPTSYPVAASLALRTQAFGQPLAQLFVQQLALLIDQVHTQHCLISSLPICCPIACLPSLIALLFAKLLRQLLDTAYWSTP